VLTTGTPHRIASTSVIPNGSVSDATAAIDPFAHSGSIGAICPIIRTWLCSPSSSTSARSAGASFPSP
jgi:hypothetical protein